MDGNSSGTTPDPGSPGSAGGGSSTSTGAWDDTGRGACWSGYAATGKALS